MSTARLLPRHALMLLWFCLLAAGCVAQLWGQIVPGAVGNAVEAVQLTKNPLAGSGQWTMNDDGTVRMQLQLDAPREGGAKGFRVKNLALADITSINVGITAADISPPILPAGADTLGNITLTTAGQLPALSFSSIPAGEKRILTITGKKNGVAVPGATIKCLLDLTGNGSSFEISQRTTSAALIFASLSGATAAAVSTTALNTFLDQVTGVTVGSVYPHTFVTHPALVDQVGIVNALNANGGSVAGLPAASTYRRPGARIRVQFYLDPGGATVASDQPNVFVTDPVSNPVQLPHHLAGSGTTNIAIGTTQVQYGDDNQVTVTFNSVASGTWDVGVLVPGDSTASPNAKYYHFPLSGTRSAGHKASVSVTDASVAAATLLTPVGSLPYLDPKYVAGQVRWRDSSSVTPAAVDIKGTLATHLATTIQGSGSADLTCHVGPTLATVPLYTLSGAVSLPGGCFIELLGPPNVPEGLRPAIGAPDSRLSLQEPGHLCRDVRFNGMSVSMAGGTLERVTVDKIRGNVGAGTVVAVQANTGTANALQGVHVFDVRNLSNVNGSGVAGIVFGGTALGSIANCLVDDNKGAGENFSVRLDNPGAATNTITYGIQVSAGNTPITNCTVHRIGYIGGLGIARTVNAAGILRGSLTGGVIDFCTVSGSEASSLNQGIVANSGTVSNCEVQNIPHVAASSSVTGLQIGAVTNGANVDAINNKILNLGSALSGCTVAGINGTAPNAAALLRIQGNSVGSSQAQTFTGINISPNSGTASESFLVKGNAVSGCGGPNGSTTVFAGISVAPNSGSVDLTIEDNDINFNVFQGEGALIRTYAATGTSVVHHNRISNNTLKFVTASNTFMPIIDLQESGAATRCSNNIITNNSFLDDLGTGTCNSQAICVRGSGSQVVDLVNNLIHGNSYFSDTGGSHGIAIILAFQRPINAISNRIFDISYTGPGGWAALRGIQLWGGTQRASAGTMTFDHNMVSLQFLGTASQRWLIEVGTKIGDAVDLTYNSFYQGSGGVTVVNENTVGQNAGAFGKVENNVVVAGVSGAATQAIISNGNAATLMNNTVFPYANIYFNGTSDSNGTAGLVRTVTNPFASQPGPASHLMPLISAEIPSELGGTGPTITFDSGASCVRGSGSGYASTVPYTGGVPGNQLYDEPVWP